MVRRSEHVSLFANTHSAKLMWSMLAGALNNLHEGGHSRLDSTWLVRHRRSHMKQEIEYLPGTRHRATQTGCRHWAPVVQQSADEQVAAKGGPPVTDVAEDPMPTGEKNPA